LPSSLLPVSNGQRAGGAALPQVDLFRPRGKKRFGERQQETAQRDDVRVVMTIRPREEGGKPGRGASRSSSDCFTGRRAGTVPTWHGTGGKGKNPEKNREKLIKSNHPRTWQERLRS